MTKLVKITMQDDSDSCLYCGMPLYKGEIAYLDQSLDSVFCSFKCDQDYRLFDPIANVNNPL